jgi:hypothetical protein
LANTDFRSQVDDAVDALERAGDDILVSNIANNEFGLGAKILRPSAVTVDLLDQAVEYADIVAATK